MTGLPYGHSHRAPTGSLGPYEAFPLSGYGDAHCQQPPHPPAAALVPSPPEAPMGWLLSRLRGEFVTVTFLVTSPAHTRVRADLYCCGADFRDLRVAMFDWKFVVHTRERAWRRFLRVCRQPLLQVEMQAA